MASVQVNPPPLLRIPKAFLSDPEIRAFMEQQNTIIFQLYNRTGGNDDIIDEVIVGGSDAATIARALALRPSNLFNQQSQIDDASDRIEANTIDLATRPRMSDLFRANQRVDELIDELITQLESLNTGVSDAGQQSACLQVKILKQMKLLNLRTEEAFDTKLNEEDIE